ncbi:MAG: hypothetical protein L0228_17335 [Planctomycetes bacterium]|nr:hypothetical protein [Planctomycetota bacterium]
MYLWCNFGLFAAIAIGWVGAIIHLSGHAPLGLVSLGIGIALGAALSALAATLRVAGKKQLIIGTIALALVAVVAQHAWLYRDFRRQWHEARAQSPHVAMFRPETPWTPGEYFHRELSPQRVALWCVDAAFITAAATGVVVVRQRKRQ